MFGTIRKHSQSLWIVIIIFTVISFVVFFTPGASPRDWFDPDKRSGGLDPAEATAQRQVYIGYLLQGVADPSRLKVDLDGDGDGDWDRVEYEGRLRALQLAKAEALGIAFGPEAANDEIQRQFSVGGKFNHTLYKQLLARIRISEDDLREYVGSQLALDQLNLVMGAGGALVSSKVFGPILAQDLEQFDTEVAAIRASDFNGSITNVAAGLKEYYTNNTERYRQPDTMKIAYLKLDYKSGRVEARKEQRAIAPLLRAKDYRLEELRAIATNRSLVMTEEEVPLRDINQHKLGEALQRIQGLGPNTVLPEPISIENDGLYIAGLVKRIEGELPKFETLDAVTSNALRQTYVEEKSMNMANERGRQFYTNLSNQLAAGKKFSEITQAHEKSHGVKWLEVPPFAMKDTSTDAFKLLKDFVELPDLKQAVRGLPPESEMAKPADRATRFVATAKGGFVLHLRKRIPASKQEVQLSLSGEDLRARRQQSQEEASRDHYVPTFGPQRVAMAPPNWFKPELEKIKLEFYLKALDNKIRAMEDERKHIQADAGTQSADPKQLVKQAQLEEIEGGLKALAKRKQAVEQYLNLK